MSNMLTNRKFNTADYPRLRDGWYTPMEILRQYPSVQHVELFNTTSSAGDWQGWITQKIGKRVYVIIFWQENNFPYRGFTANTDCHPIISFLDENPMSNGEINQALAESLESE